LSVKNLAPTQHRHEQSNSYFWKRSFLLLYGQASGFGQEQWSAGRVDAETLALEAAVEITAELLFALTAAVFAVYEFALEMTPR
jgi:hypothetical protein